MEVLKHGKKFRITVCPDCDCEFQFAATEIKNHIFNHIDDGFYMDVDYIKCPECDKEIWLERRGIEI